VSDINDPDRWSPLLDDLITAIDRNVGLAVPEIRAAAERLVGGSLLDPFMLRREGRRARGKAEQARPPRARADVHAEGVAVRPAEVGADRLDRRALDHRLLGRHAPPDQEAAPHRPRPQAHAWTRLVPALRAMAAA
jgi:hypothetical protein